MPELPEVEVLRRQLDKEFSGRRIKEIEVITPKYARSVHVGTKRVQKRHIAPKDFNGRVKGAKIKKITRKGKYLAWELDNDEVALFHLGMSGRLVKALKHREPDPHTHVVVHFSQGAPMRMFDARRFGELLVAGREEYEEFFERLGMDAINDQIPWQLLGELINRRQTKMKNLLMDQEFIAGLGNIYSDEVLFLSGLPWNRDTSSLTSNEVRRLSRGVGEVLQEAIKNRGTTLQDGGWADLYDEPGEHQDGLWVFQREGEPCRRCRTPVKKQRVGNRSHFYCPQCQSVKTRQRKAASSSSSKSSSKKKGSSRKGTSSKKK